jgi:hypothetical protein
LPERLPAGEGILWQGSPAWWPLARRALHLRGLAIYFALLVLWRMAESWREGASALETLASSGMILGLGLVCLGTLLVIGCASAKAALYTVTNQRVVMRVGVALPMTINIPFSAVEAAAVRRYADGTEDIVLTLMEGHRVSWVALWPHTRPWRVSKPEPALRAVPQSAGAAQAIARALAASADQPVTVVDGAASAPTILHGAAVA